MHNVHTGWSPQTKYLPTPLLQCILGLYSKLTVLYLKPGAHKVKLRFVALLLQLVETRVHNICKGESARLSIYPI